MNFPEPLRLTFSQVEAHLFNRADRLTDRPFCRMEHNDNQQLKFDLGGIKHDYDVLMLRQNNGVQEPQLGTWSGSGIYYPPVCVLKTKVKRQDLIVRLIEIALVTEELLVVKVLGIKAMSVGRPWAAFGLTNGDVEFTRQLVAIAPRN